MMKRILAIGTAAMLMLEGCSGSSAEGSGAVPTAGYFSEFSAETFDRESVVTQEQLADYDLNMINIWATFCGPCINEMPDLAELADEYEGQGLQIIGICSDVYNGESIDAELMAAGQEIIDTTGADYLHLIPDDAMVTGLLSDVFAVPSTYFVDSEGNTLKIVVGAKSKEDWKTQIDELLSEVRAGEE